MIQVKDSYKKKGVVVHLLNCNPPIKIDLASATKDQLKKLMEIGHPSVEEAPAKKEKGIG